jgi:hypothetical protein
VHSWITGPYPLYTRDTHWLPELNRILTGYFPQRTNIVLNQFRGAGLYPSVAAPVFNQHGGVIEAGFSLTMTAPTGTLYFTADGSDPRVYGTGEPAPTAGTYTRPVVLNDPTHIKARALNGATWSALNEAFFRVPRPLDALRVTEIMYHPADTGPAAPDAYEFLELKNCGAQVLDLTDVRLGGGISFVFPEGTIAAPGEFILLAVDEAAFGDRHPMVPVHGTYQGNLSNAGDTIELRNAQGELQVTVTYGDIAPWPDMADGWGRSLVPLDPVAEGDPGSPSYWRISHRFGGSPGADDTPLAPEAPTIVSHPQDMTVTAGEPATFTVAATGIPSPTFQWERDGAAIPDAVGTAYSIPETSLADNGARFRCVATNDQGSMASREATLTVHPAPKQFRRADSNVDGELNIADAVYTLSALFHGAQAFCDDASDVNDDGNVDIADPIAFLSHLFADGIAPAEPYPGCGTDPTLDDLGCEVYTRCPGG